MTKYIAKYIEHLRGFWGLLFELGRQLAADDIAQHAAALTYYVLFSLAPLLVLATALVAYFFGTEATHEELAAQLEILLSPAAAQTVQEIVKNASAPNSSLLATLISVAVMAFAATRGFIQLQHSLNTIWGLQTEIRHLRYFLWDIVRKRLLSFAMVLLVALLLLVSLTLSTTIRALSSFAEGWAALPFSTPFWGMALVNNLISYLLTVLLLAVAYRLLPDATARWRDVGVGAAVAAALLMLIKYCISLYLGTLGISSTYGAAGSLVVLLLFIYYSAMILLLGAECTRVYARWRGSSIIPAPYTVQANPNGASQADRSTE